MGANAYAERAHTHWPLSEQGTLAPFCQASLGRSLARFKQLALSSLAKCASYYGPARIEAA